MSGSRKAKNAYAAGVATKESVLTEAIRLISQSGYYGFSLRDVARVVGVSHPAVIYHFPTKEALLFAAAKRCEDKMGIFNVSLDSETGKLIDRGMIPATIGKLGLAMLDLAIAEDFKVAVSFDLAVAVEANRPGHPLYEHYQYKFDTLVNFIEEGIDSLKESGVVPAAGSSELVAERLVSLWYGTVLTNKFRHPDDSGTEAVGVYLAEVGGLLGLKSETILQIAVSVPERLAPAFQRVMRANQVLTQ